MGKKNMFSTGRWGIWLAGFVSCALWIQPLRAQNFTGGFSFYLPPQDSAGRTFFPHFPPRPIGNTGFVTVDSRGHFSFRGERIRFFGTNAVAGGAFPTRSKAAFIAGRLRKMGFNLIRFHHMDNPWGAGSLFHYGQDTRHLNPETLDRFETWIHELKRNGIFTNINLHVSRTFTVQDGVADADSILNFGKGVTLFDPWLIQLQKEYARQLLTHTNPYTGLSLAADPVMAMVEITNENSLYRMWRDGKLKHQSLGGDLIRRHVQLLDSLWHDYLLIRYSTTADLREAWQEGAIQGDGEDQISDGTFESKPVTQFWDLELHNASQAVVGTEVITPFEGRFSARIVVSQADGTGWHIQWKYKTLSVEEDSLYSIAFAARSDAARTIHVAVMKDVSPWTSFTSVPVHLTGEWKVYQFSFRAPETFENQTRLSFMLGSEAGTYWFDDIHFTPGSVAGLLEEEALETRNVRRIDFSQCPSFSDARVRDLTRFYLDLQSRYYEEMVRYLRSELGVRVPVVGTNWNVGSPDLAVQSRLDYMDNHAYWDHPQFPSVPWSSTDWRIENTPMVQSVSGGTIPGLMGGVPFEGKPFTLSEYNHAFPNRYQAEGVLFLTAYSAFHGCDGILFFDYSGSADDWETDKVDGFFSIHRNTAMMALMPSCAFAFRSGYISEALHTILLSYGRDQILTMPRYDTGGWQGMETFPRTLALRHAVRSASFESEFPLDPAGLPPEPEAPFVTDTDEIVWDPQGLFQVTAPAFVGLAGFLDRYPSLTAGPMDLVSASGFGVFTWISLTGEPLDEAELSLMTVSARLQNTGMVWDGVHTVHDRWGSPPTQMQPMVLSLRLRLMADSLRIWLLDETGLEQGFSTVRPEGGIFEFDLDQTRQSTVWYGIQVFSQGSSVRDSDRDRTARPVFSLLANYPNPFAVESGIRDETVIPYQLPDRGKARLRIYNVLGKEVRTLVEEDRSGGSHRAAWDGRDAAGRKVESGIYFYVLEFRKDTGVRRKVRKLLVVR
jgi:hypothetical protein